MIKISRIFLIALLLSNSACATFPPKDYMTVKWLAMSGACFERLLPNDVVETVCIDDNSDMIGMSLRDIDKELNYQNLLIKSCKRWK